MKKNLKMLLALGMVACITVAVEVRLVIMLPALQRVPQVLQRVQ